MLERSASVVTSRRSSGKHLEGAGEVQLGVGGVGWVSPHGGKGIMDLEGGRGRAGTLGKVHRAADRGGAGTFTRAELPGDAARA